MAIGTGTAAGGKGEALAAAFALLLNNGVPAFGVLVLGWSVPLVLLLYWVENLVGVLACNGLIRRHETLTGLRGHYRSQLGLRVNGRSVQRFHREHLLAGLGFTLAHGVLLAALALLALDVDALGGEAGWIALLVALCVLGMGVESLGAAQGLQQRPFAFVRSRAERSMGLVTSMHLGVLLGAVAVFGGVTAPILALLFIGLRALVDLGALVQALRPQALAGGDAPASGLRALFRKALADELAERRADELPQRPDARDA